MKTNWLKKAQDRVQNTVRLSPYYSIIFYDWPEGDEHLKWVATAPCGEIVEWAEQIRKAEQEAED